MGDEDTADHRRAASAPYRIDDALLDAAVRMRSRCTDLPAHLGEEIAAEVLYGARQRIWDQAENRRHAQKALLELLVESPSRESDSHECTPGMSATPVLAARTPRRMARLPGRMARLPRRMA